ncbi:MAG TPA: hypothetical protein VN428_16155 [Bryobacteraceae bacterium]|nr:hypothetical protein [Bryobacteraceae bacterium]
MYFRFTLFNGITLLILVATLWTAYARFRTRPDSIWFLGYYALVAAYWYAFDGALGTYWMIGGLAVALTLRFEFLGGTPLKLVRAAEYVFLAYVAWRAIALLLMLPR